LAAAGESFRADDDVITGGFIPEEKAVVPPSSSRAEIPASEVSKKNIAQQLSRILRELCGKALDHKIRRDSAKGANDPA
jgi:hypothetical protein